MRRICIASMGCEEQPIHRLDHNAANGRIYVDTLEMRYLKRMFLSVEVW